MACDICGKTGTCLSDLKTYYQTDDIKQICLDCGTDVNNHLSKLREMNQKMNEHWIKKFIITMKSKLTKETK